jgi:photosystem II stability/assembly factor-like uncharacterized protein
MRGWNKTEWQRITALLIGATLLLTLGGPVGTIRAQGNEEVLFPETGQTVRGRFLEYWRQNGGLAQQGFPITGEMQERSATDGKTYTVQYFERAVFELHPENRRPYDVLLSLLGVFEFKSKYPEGAPGQAPNRDPGTIFFPQTGKHLGGAFHHYWLTHGGLPQQGYPISNEFVEVSPLDGKPYTVQYFERAVFEYHPEYRGTAYEVLLSHLGTFRFRQQYLDVPPVRPVSLSRTQSRPKLSSQYLVWNEATTPPGLPRVPGSGDIVGLDLRSHRVIDVSRDEAGDQELGGISGSVVVWSDNRHSNSGSKRDIMVRDLPGGERSVLAGGPADQFQPDISGRTVVWREVLSGTERLMSADLDSGTAVEITSTVGLTGTAILDPKVSDDYIVWTASVQIGPKPGSGESFIHAYNRRTGSVRTIIRSLGSYIFAGPGYALADRRLVVPVTFNQGSNSQPVMADLDTGRLTPIDTGAPMGQHEMYAPSLAGNILVWSASSSRAASGDIWGMDLRSKEPKLLVTGRGSQNFPAVTEDQLAWVDASGPKMGLVSAMSLPAAFATAQERHKALPRIPESKPEDYRAIQILSPEDGWAIGGDGLIMRLRNGKWERVPSPLATFLNDISMVSPTEGWIASTLGFLRYVNGRWSVVDEPAARNMSLFSVEMLSADEGWVAGSRGLLRYNGGRWERIASPDESYNSVEMISKDEGWAVGNYSVISHYKDGVWEEQLKLGYGGLYDVDMVSNTEGWAVGDVSQLLHYQNGRWDQVPYAVEANALSIDMVSPTEGWAVGRGGGIMRYANGRWSLVETGIRGILNLTAIDMTSPTEGWAVGSEGIILRCQNGKWSVYQR